MALPGRGCCEACKLVVALTLSGESRLMIHSTPNRKFDSYRLLLYAFGRKLAADSVGLLSRNSALFGSSPWLAEVTKLPVPPTRRSTITVRLRLTEAESVLDLTVDLA